MNFLIRRLPIYAMAIAIFGELLRPMNPIKKSGAWSWTTRNARASNRRPLSRRPCRAYCIRNPQLIMGICTWPTTRARCIVCRWRRGRRFGRRRPTTRMRPVRWWRMEKSSSATWSGSFGAFRQRMAKYSGHITQRRQFTQPQLPWKMISSSPTTMGTSIGCRWRTRILCGRLLRATASMRPAALGKSRSFSRVAIRCCIV